MIKQEGDQYVLYSKDGSKVLGRHASHQDALNQEELIANAKPEANAPEEKAVETYSSRGNRITVYK